MIADLDKIKKAHFVGIGGIGISALARFFLFEGKTVTGSDLVLTSPIVAELKKQGAKISHGHKASQVPAGCQLLVYSLAIPESNPERRAATRRGLTQLSYPQALGLISQGKFTIAVAGTHGKTTTAAMVADILLAARRDPMVIVGSLLRRPDNHRSNFIAGEGPVVVEACEYRRSFLNLSPRILVITNIDTDHLDYYRDLADIQSAFAELAAKVPPDGFLICDRQNPKLQPVLLNTRCLTIDYRRLGRGFKLKVPGEHNILNAQAALAAAKVLRISPSLALGALNKFKGTWRRFEDRGQTRSGARLYDDYAHHPTEIRATLAAARAKFPKRRIVVVFQPHLYSRTKLLFDDFVVSFSQADEVLVLPIYAAREARDPAVTSQILAAAIQARYFPTFAAAEKYLNQRLGRGDLLLTMGAGDVYVLTQALSVEK